LWAANSSKNNYSPTHSKFFLPSELAKNTARRLSVHGLRARSPNPTRYENMEMEMHDRAIETKAVTSA
jgi:hypothetical protein